ncbi:Carbohydrate-binding protein [Zostera marina]|uniref:Carbohydrate-binding protein n=1 Tax=Zostera marina TaxID=29655 RepID=A0A0K9NTA4_ZOSMR|nr:Carbohydrate-binding protein [Zostera marina]
MDLTEITTFVVKRRQRRLRNLLFLVAAGFAGYGAYKSYHLPFVTRKREKLANLLKTIVAFTEAISSYSSTLCLLSSDINRFLRSESDEIPSSIRQISKISSSDEFLESVTRISESITVGVLRGFRSNPTAISTNLDFSDKILDRLFSDSGTGFVSAIAGNLVKGLVTGVDKSASGRGRDQWMHLLCEDKSIKMIGECVERFVTTAVTVYLEKTTNVNTYNQMFAGLTHPNHSESMKELLTTVCNGAVESLVKTSHKVLAKKNPSDNNLLQKTPLVDDNSSMGGGSHRRLVMDITGRVAFDTVRSFLEFCLNRFGECGRTGVSVIREEILGRGAEIVKYVSAKSLLVLTICFSFCLHLLPTSTATVGSGGSKLIMPTL